MAIKNHGSSSKKTPQERLEELLADLNIGHIRDSMGYALSGGERRRAALLRALSVHPEILILDEPTASLDDEGAGRVLATIGDALRRWRFACVLITHDMRLAGSAHRVLQFRNGALE